MTKDVNAYEIRTDGTTVWVNTAAGAIGRFGRWGIDVHTTAGDGCLHCTQGLTSAPDWEMFCADMARYHGVTIHAHYRPAYAREKRTRT